MTADEGGGGLLSHHLSYWTTSMPPRDSMLAIPVRDAPFCSRAELNSCPANSLWATQRRQLCGPPRPEYLWTGAVCSGHVQHVR